MFSEEEESFEKVATSIYQADTLTLQEAIHNPKEAETLYQKTEKGIPIKNEDTVILQDCILLYHKNIRIKLRNNHELTPTERTNMVGMYLKLMYPANATEVSAMVHAASDGEKKWLVEQPGGLKR
jgi:hypothetical protein